MAISYAASSMILTSPSPKPCCASLKNASITTTTTTFLGFSVVSSRPCIRTSAKQTFRVRCQDKAVVPLDQRWMFEESEINGPDIWNKTWYPKAADHVPTDKPWYVVDASDKILGRLASTIAIYIRGKNLATYTPSVDMGAFVIVVNAEKVAVSGKKRTQKLYRRHSGRPGGMTVETFDQLQQRIPERIVEHAVRGMLPKGRDSIYFISKRVEVIPCASISEVTRWRISLWERKGWLFKLLTTSSHHFSQAWQSTLQPS